MVIVIHSQQVEIEPKCHSLVIIILQNVQMVNLKYAPKNTKQLNMN